MDAPESRHGGIGSRDIHRDQSDQQRTPARTLVALYAEAGDAQLLERWKQLERKRVFDPVLVDDWLDLRFHVLAHLLYDCQLLGGQVRSEFIEVTIRYRQWLVLFGFFHG